MRSVPSTPAPDKPTRRTGRVEPLVLDAVTLEPLPQPDLWPDDCCCDCPGCRAQHEALP